MLKTYTLLTVLLLGGCVTVGSGHQYGCWCGKNIPAETDFPEPIDAWDQSCKTHDLCYRERGIENPECDFEFTRELKRLRSVHGRMPGQLQAAHDFFRSRRQTGGIFAQAEFTREDFEKKGMETECAQR